MLLPTPADAAELVAQTFLAPRYVRVATGIPGSRSELVADRTVLTIKSGMSIEDYYKYK